MGLTLTMDSEVPGVVRQDIASKFTLLRHLPLWDARVLTASTFANFYQQVGIPPAIATLC
jgi:hypothetical protein